MSERCYRLPDQVIVELKTKKGLVTRLAKALNASKSKVSHWVNGTYGIPESVFLDFCRNAGILPTVALPEEAKKFIQNFV